MYAQREVCYSHYLGITSRNSQGLSKSFYEFRFVQTEQKVCSEIHASCFTLSVSVSLWLSYLPELGSFLFSKVWSQKLQYERNLHLNYVIYSKLIVNCTCICHKIDQIQQVYVDTGITFNIEQTKPSNLLKCLWTTDNYVCTESLHGDWLREFTVQRIQRCINGNEIASKITERHLVKSTRQKWITRMIRHLHVQ